MKIDNSKLIMIVAVLVILRFVSAIPVLNEPSISWEPDTYSYLRVSENILTLGTFHDPGDGNLDLYRTPGYPLLLALFGVFFRDVELPVVLFQLTLGVMIAGLIYDALKRLSSVQVAAVAAIIFLIMPVSWLTSLTLLTETLFSFLVVISWWALVRWQNMPARVWLFISGLSLGLAALVRPIGLPLILLWAAIILVRDSKTLRERAGNAGVFFLVAGVVVFSWLIRNQIVWDTLSLSPIGIWNLAHYVVPSTLSEALGISLEDARSMVPALHSGVQPGEPMDYIRVLLTYPFAFFKTHLLGTIAILIDPARGAWIALMGGNEATFGSSRLLMEGNMTAFMTEFMQSTKKSSSMSILLGMLFTVLFMLAVYWKNLEVWFSLVKGKRRISIPLLLALSTILFLLITPGVVGNARFRVPAEPFLAIFAALAIGARWWKPSEDEG